MVISTGVNVFLEVVLGSVVICDFFEPACELLHILVGSVGFQGSKQVFVLFKGQFPEELIAALLGVFDEQPHVVLDSLLGVLAG